MCIVIDVAISLFYNKNIASMIHTYIISQLLASTVVLTTLYPYIEYAFQHVGVSDKIQVVFMGLSTLSSILSMIANSHQDKRKQMEEEIASLKRTIKEYQRCMTERVDTVETKLDTKIDTVDTKIDTVETKLDTKIDMVDAKFYAAMEDSRPDKYADEFKAECLKHWYDDDED